MKNRTTTETAQIPGAFDGETVTRRRLMTVTAHGAGLVATAAIVLPAVGFAIGPALKRQPTTWQPVGPPEDFPDSTYVPRVINLTSDNIGEIGKTTVFVRRRDPRIDTEPADEW